MTLNDVRAPEKSSIPGDCDNTKPVKMPFIDVGKFHLNTMYEGPISTAVGGSTPSGTDHT